MSGMEIIEQMRGLPTEEKRGIVEQIWKEFGGELGWIDPDLTPIPPTASCELAGTGPNCKRSQLFKLAKIYGNRQE